MTSPPLITTGTAGHRLRVLGPPRIESPIGARLSRAHQPRPLALLSLLGVAGDQGMTRERLVGLLWGEHDDGRARRNLSNTLYVAHHDLGGDTITTSGAAVHLNPARISTDVETFRAARGRSDPATAVAAYGGPLLEGFYLSGAPAFEEWLAIERRQHEEEYAAALEALARVCEVDGDHVAAVRWWHRLGALDPLNSRVAIGTARALVASGDRGNALEHLRTHCDRLHEELGIEQPPEITAALEEVRSAEAYIPAPVAVTTPETPEPVARDRTPAELISPPSTPRTPRGTARRRAWWAAAAILVPVAVAVAVAIVRASRAPPGPVSLDLDRVAVMPFRVASPDEKIRELTTYVPDLFWEALSGEFGPRIAEPVPVVRRWRAAGGATDAPLTDGEARAVARAAGAGRVMIGSVSGTLGRLTLTATIQDARRGLTLAPPTAVEGPYDSVRSLVGRLATLLLAKDAGAPPHRYRDLVSHPVRGVQVYLTGLRAARRGPWNREFFDLALQLDSTLLIAALAAYQAGEFDQYLARELCQDQERLSAPDRSFMWPLVEWRLGASRSLVERIAQFDSAAH